jgi:hypothetical protein
MKSEADEKRSEAARKAWRTIRRRRLGLDLPDSPKHRAKLADEFEAYYKKWEADFVALAEEYAEAIHVTPEVALRLAHGTAVHTGGDPVEILKLWIKVVRPPADEP